VRGLAAHRLFPGETKPSEVFEDRGFKLRPRAALIDVFDTQQEAAVCLSRGVKRGQRGEGVAEMQIAGGLGGEAGDKAHCSPV